MAKKALPAIRAFMHSLVRGGLRLGQGSALLWRQRIRSVVRLRTRQPGESAVSSAANAASRAETGINPSLSWLRYLLPCAVLLLMFAVVALWSCGGRKAPDAAGDAGSISPESQEVIRRALSEMAGLPFEESLAAPMADEVKKADYALVQAMAGLGLPAANITLAYTEFRHVGDEAYPFQSLRVGMDRDGETFAAALRESFTAWSVDAMLFPLRENAYGISVSGHPTHELILRPHDPAGTPPPAAAVPGPGVHPASSGKSDGNTGVVPWRLRHRAPGETPRMVIVMDDLGESLRDLDALVALPYPVTCAVWPDSSHAKKVAERAHFGGLEVIVHLPTEPVKYPEVKPGPNALFAGMDAARIEQLVSRALSRVPYAVGLNNHMGSRFTQNAAAVRPVIATLAARKLFALDSLTHPASVFYTEARAAGLPALRRDVFLDVEPDKAAVLRQLAKAERAALLTGQAVVIGHPLPGTMAALKEWGRTRNREIRLVTLQELLP